MESNYPCILFSHQSLERDKRGIHNIDEFRHVIRRVNRDKKRIILCINGHHHRDYLRIYENVCYFDLNSASMDWIGVSHKQFPVDMTDKYPLLDKVVVYNDPIHAIIELFEDGTIKIKGMSSSFFMNVNRKTVGAALCDDDGRLSTANVLSVSLLLNTPILL